jgi:two-component system phosphate regulon sensor histidine kinase PhoR
MNWFTGILLAAALAVILFLGWRLARLRRRMDAYARALRRAAETVPLPVDVPGLENVSNAVAALAESFQARLDARESERARLAAVLDQMTDGVLIADAEGIVRFANPAAERMFGEGISILGRTVAGTLRQHQMIEAWQKSLQEGKIQSESVEIPGRRQFLQLVVMPDRHGGGSLLLVQDLTRVRRLETVRRDFISNVSHELRTPLASLKALTETLQEGALDDPPAARRFLGRIETEVDTLTQMAAELLELTRIESGQVPLDLKAVSPSGLLHSAADRMKMQAERAGLALRVECPPGLPQVLADAPRLEQVLINLLHNAIKFTPPGGEVLLLAETGEGVVRFAVRDTGAGIPADDLPRIFERFYKSDRARSGGGTGLGLSIARHLVEAHGGNIRADSMEGRGSTFTFTIPAAR